MNLKGVFLDRDPGPNGIHQLSLGDDLSRANQESDEDIARPIAQFDGALRSVKLSFPPRQQVSSEPDIHR